MGGESKSMLSVFFISIYLNNKLQILVKLFLLLQVSLLLKIDSEKRGFPCFSWNIDTFKCLFLLKFKKLIQFFILTKNQFVINI